MERSEKIVTYVAEVERDFLRAAAALLGMSDSTYLRFAGLRVALEAANSIPGACEAFRRSAMAALEEAEYVADLAVELAEPEPAEAVVP